MKYKKYYIIVIVALFSCMGNAEFINTDLKSKLALYGISNNIEIITKQDFLKKGLKRYNDSLMNNHNVVFEIKGDFNNNKKTDWILSCKEMSGNTNYYLLFLEFNSRDTNILDVVKNSVPSFIVKDKVSSSLIPVGYEVDSGWMDYYSWNGSNYVETNLSLDDDGN